MFYEFYFIIFTLKIKNIKLSFMMRSNPYEYSEGFLHRTCEAKIAQW